MYKAITKLMFICPFLYFCTSCYDTKKLTYFNDVNETVLLSNNEDNTEHKIQKHDLLNIQVSSLNEDASKIFNITNNYVSSTTSSTGSRAESSGYLVNPEGEIQMPMIGKIKVEGMTMMELKEYITKKLIDKKLLLEPIVMVKYMNFEVTIMGEVSRPTVINVPTEKISLLKALGVAGDITAFGKKENVMLIRESEGKKIVKRINLNSSSFLQSPFYYLQPNDIVYVEANKNKEASVSRNRILLSSILSTLSVLIIILDRLFRN